MNKFLIKLSTKLLLAAERFYLRAHGWIKVGPDSWDTPLDYKFKARLGIRQGHAVNSQKQDLFSDLGSRPRSGTDDLKQRLGLNRKQNTASNIGEEGNN